MNSTSVYTDSNICQEPTTDYVKIVVGILFFCSEILPFIGKKDQNNGFIQIIHELFVRSERSERTVRTVRNTPTIISAIEHSNH